MSLPDVEFTQYVVIITIMSPSLSQFSDLTNISLYLFGDTREVGLQILCDRHTQGSLN